MGIYQRYFDLIAAIGIELVDPPASASTTSGQHPASPGAAITPSPPPTFTAIRIRSTSAPQA